jgi:outer membrane immunogenic protein
VNFVPGHKGEVNVKNLLLAGIALVALAAPAVAADMPLKAPAPVAVDIWSGGYVGANVGYDWGRDIVDSVGSPGNCSTVGQPGCNGAATLNYYSFLSAQAATFQASVNHSGLIYGGQAGHNWLLHNIAWTWDGVIGVEVDFQGKSDSHSSTYTSVTPAAAFPGFPLTQTATLNERINALGTLRGRAGLLWGPNTLVYVTGGLAFANARSNTGIAQNVTSAGLAPYATAGQITQEVFGPTIGGGIEWKWTANWSVKAEYLYVDLGDLAYNTNALISPFAGAGGGNFSVANVNQTVHIHDNIARVGVNYRFW